MVQPEKMGICQYIICTPYQPNHQVISRVHFNRPGWKLPTWGDQHLGRFQYELASEEHHRQSWCVESRNSGMKPHSQLCFNHTEYDLSYALTRLSMTAAEAVQQLKALVTLAQDTGLSSRPHRTICSFSPRGFDALFWPSWALGTHVIHIHTRGPYVYAHKIDKTKTQHRTGVGICRTKLAHCEIWGAVKFLFPKKHSSHTKF